jgi:hypothetical protein
MEEEFDFSSYNKIKRVSNEELAEFICCQHTMCVNCIGQNECCVNANGAKTWLDAESEEES